MRPLVSVVICTYNRSSLLQRSIESVRNQDYPNLEIIVVDDCSRDDTFQVVKNVMENDRRVTYYRHGKNRKLAAARNTGVHHANGKFIAIMDDDDEWIDSEKLTKQVKILEDARYQGTEIVCTSVKLIDQSGNFQNKLIEEPDDLYSHILIRNGIFYSPTLLIRANLFDKIRYDESLQRGVDSDLLRNAILNLRAKVFFLGDITTAIHEYGCDRITENSSWKELIKIYKSTFYIFRKYKYHFLIRPFTFLIRLKSLALYTASFLLSQIFPGRG